MELLVQIKRILFVMFNHIIIFIWKAWETKTTGKLVPVLFNLFSIVTSLEIKKQ